LEAVDLQRHAGDLPTVSFPIQREHDVVIQVMSFEEEILIRREDRFEPDQKRVDHQRLALLKLDSCTLRVPELHRIEPGE
jgi:hypothetical protein